MNTPGRPLRSERGFLPCPTARAAERPAASTRYVLAATALLLAAQAQAAVEGRWEGVAEVPGLAVPLVVDLAPRDGGWIGAATLPSRGVAGAPLLALQVNGSTVHATIAIAPGTPEGSAIRLLLQLPGPDLPATGQLEQGGHRAPLSLRRSGAAQLPDAHPAGPWPGALDGVWRGHYDIGFGAREVTLRLGAAGAAMTVVGRRSTEIAFDDARVLGAFVILRADQVDMTIEAPAASAARGRLDATLRQGPFTSALRLQRDATP